jgi:hypothetical protein
MRFFWENCDRWDVPEQLCRIIIRQTPKLFAPCRLPCRNFCPSWPLFSSVSVVPNWGVVLMEAIHLRSVSRSVSAFHGLSCHPWPCMLLNLRSKADSNPFLSASTFLSSGCKSVRPALIPESGRIHRWPTGKSISPNESKPRTGRGIAPSCSPPRSGARLGAQGRLRKNSRRPAGRLLSHPHSSRTVTAISPQSGQDCGSPLVLSRPIPAVPANP